MTSSIGVARLSSSLPSISSRARAFPGRSAISGPFPLATREPAKDGPGRRIETSENPAMRRCMAQIGCRKAGGSRSSAIAPVSRSGKSEEPSMDLRFTAEEVAFRDEVRAFIADNLPEDIRERMRLGHPAEKADTIRWQRILNARGWAAYSWPKEYGGPGWTPVQRMMFLEENQLAPAPDMQVFNVTMIGPVLIQFGTDEQKRRFLPRAADVDDWWCQGFSEPGAGSDLAALKTAAKREGDEYIVNGQKIWTSTAHMADWCFCLVRTDPHAAKRQEGISFLLIDMKTPGITVRPIISIDGTHHLNEVFFDDVKVPVAMRVGEENKGWDYAKFLLGNERTGIARLGKSKERVRFAKEAARDMRAGGRPLIEDHEFRRRIAELETELKSLEITQLRVLSAHNAGAGQQDP